MTWGLETLFPQPKRVVSFGPAFDRKGLRVEIAGGGDDPVVASGRALIAARAGSGDKTYRIEITVDAADQLWPEGKNRDEAYSLELRTSGGTLHAATAAGVYLGCQTLQHLLKDDLLPEARIVDWPDLRYRSLYIESKWGPDRMTLADWQEMIDDLARLKYNSVGIGVYGCWIVQYGGKRTEFLMLPFPDHPELITPKTLRYYSPEAEAWQTLEYLPPLVTDDFFGELVAYGKERNIAVRPHFNSPGHNTLIPRVFPEISSLDRDGNPISYGFCLSNPRTFEVLFELYDSVIERYLRPNGIEWFHMGLDEVEAYLGIDESDPTRSVDPWCQCPLCRDKPRAQQLQEYAVKVCLHLKAQGMTQITLWNDALDKLNALNQDFARMVHEAGLSENVIIEWWRYHEPVLLPQPELGLRDWSVPMAGYWSNMTTHSYTANIYPMLVNGGLAGVEGSDAYCIYDPAYDRNYVCLAEYSWNQPGGDDLFAFKSRYTQAVLGERLGRHLAAEAFVHYDQAFDSMPWTGSVLFSLFYYWHTYPAARMRGTYPRDIFLDLQPVTMRLRNGINGAVAHARKASTLFSQALGDNDDPLLSEYRVECDKLVGTWEAISTTLSGVMSYDASVTKGNADAETACKAAAAVASGKERLISVMRDLERVKKSYLQPQILRDLSILLLYLERLADEFAQLAAQVSRGGSLPRFRDLAINAEELDVYVSTAIA